MKSRLTPAEQERRRAERTAAALARQIARQQAALRLLQDWPDGMPPLSGLGVGIGTLVTLEKLGLARQVGFDGLGDRRFAITDAGCAAVAAEGVAA